MNSIFLYTRAKASSEVSKVAASSRRGGGLRTQSRFIPGLRPQVMRVKLPLHHLEEVAWEVNLALY